MHSMTPKPESQVQSLWRVETCRSCLNACVDVRSIAERLERVAEDIDFTERFRARLPAEVKHHHVFRVAVSGCPNSCSQPQIKDFGVQGRATPRRGEGDCTECLQCVEACREGAVTVTAAEPTINPGLCVHCGGCARVCPTSALETGQSGLGLMVGGKLGRHPQLAREIMGMADEDRAAETFRRSLEHCLASGRGEERFGELLNREGYGFLTGIADGV